MAAEVAKAVRAFRVFIREVYRPVGGALTFVKATVKDRPVMSRRLGSVIAVLSLLLGCVVAPYTHVHPRKAGGDDDHHAHGTTLIHTHTTPHITHRESHEPGIEPDHSERIWSVDGFVFQACSRVHSPTPALVAFVVTHPDVSSVWLGDKLTNPPAHGPPATRPVGLRAPPVSTPAIS